MSVIAWLKANSAGLEAKLLKTEAKILDDRKNAVDAEKVDMQTAIKFTTDFYEDVGERFGDKFSELSKELANDAKGKNIRNVDEAMRAFNQYKNNFNNKLNVNDRLAIKNALDSVNIQQLADNVKKMGKGFGYVGKGIDIADLLFEVEIGFDTGEWDSTLLKIETLFAGFAATGLIALIFGAAITAPIGIIGFALIMAIAGAFINEKNVKSFNDALESKLNSVISPVS